MGLSVPLNQLSAISKWDICFDTLRQTYFCLSCFLAGTLQKSTIKSESGSIIASGSPNTIWCQGTLDVELYVLHKEGNQKPWIMKTPEESGNKAKFSIPSVTQQHGGQYRCYCYSSAGWLEHSDTLELVVTGEGTVSNSAPGSALGLFPYHSIALENILAV